MTTTKNILFTLIFALLAFVQGALAQDVPAGLSVDTDYSPNEAGYYYVNMPISGQKTVTLTNSDIVFKVYDNGGKNGNYIDDHGFSNSILFYAPAGYVFEVRGRIVRLDYYDQLLIFDSDNDDIERYRLYCYNCGNEDPFIVADIGTYETTDNVMLVIHRPDDSSREGFELTVSMKQNVHVHNIAIEQQSGGTWTADVGSTAIATHDVDLTFTHDANRVLTSIKVIKTGDASTEVELTKLDDTHYRFTMPDYDVTVVPGAYDWEWTSGNTICRLDNQGVLTVSAIANTDGAMADYSQPENRPWNSEFERVNRIDVKKGVTVIGKYAFHSGLFTSAILPEGLQSIHEHAFRYCYGLTSIIISYTVHSIAAGAFYACFGLQHIYTYAQAADISWGVNSWDFIRNPEGVNPGPFTVMHVLPSQVAAYQKKNLNVSVVGDLTPSGNWTDSGNYADSFSQQNGNTITITNEPEMARLAYMVNVMQNTYRGYTIKLDRDLNMFSHEWSPIGTNQRPFEGTFDGQGHTINGIVVNRSGSAYNGLFGYVGGYQDQSPIGFVKNVSLKQSSITGGDYTGGLVGYLLYGKVENCFTDASVSGGQYVGGLVGAMKGATYNNSDRMAYVSNSLYMGSHVSGSENQNVSAVVGGKLNNRCTITSYYTNRSVSTTSQLDIYAVKAVDESSGDITVTYDGSGKIDYEGDTYGATNGTANFIVHATDPYKKLASVIVNDEQIATKAGTFSFGICSSANTCRINAMLSDAQLAGSGTKSDPYRIAVMDDWNLFAELVAGGATFSGKFVKQMDQIGDQNGNPFNGITTMVGESEELSFQGTFDGDMYYLISSINSTADYAAPFRYVKNATIKNMKVAGTFNVGKHGSALVGRTYGTTLIDSIWIHSAAISSSRNNDRFFGGVVGHGGNSTLTMKNILFDADMTNDGDYTGGLLGWTVGMTLNLDSCTFRGSFSGNGAFHPIAVRVPYAAMRTSARNVYFYTGPKNIDNGHIAVSAIRVQNSVPTDGNYGSVNDALSITIGYYYNDAPQGLHIDYDKERGTPGYYFVNMPGNSNQRLVIGNGVTSFMVYDDGGKLSNVCGRGCESKLTLVAPKDKILEVQGVVVKQDPYDDYLSIDDGADHNLFHFGRVSYDDEYAPESANIPQGTTADNELSIYKLNHNLGEMDGFELLVTLKDDGKIHFGAVTIEPDTSMAVIDGAYDGTEGTVISEIIGVDTVILDRSFTVGAFSTIMLPFDMSEFGIDLTRVHGAEFYGFSEMNYEDGKWTAGATKLSGHIRPNTPYLVKPTATRITIDGRVFMNTLYGGQKTVKGDWEFQGTYQYTVFGGVKEANPQNTYYGFTAQALNGYSVGQFAKAGDQAYIYPMRAYLVHNGANGSQKNAGGLGGIGTLPETIDLKIMDENGVVTETATLNTRTGEIKRDRWYDLQGRLLNGKPEIKGKYLHNGRVEVVK